MVKQITKEIYQAETGKVFKSKIDGSLLSSVLYLGIEDSIDNYEQVDESELEGADDEEPNTTNI